MPGRLVTAAVAPGTDAGTIPGRAVEAAITPGTAARAIPRAACRGLRSSMGQSPGSAADFRRSGPEEAAGAFGTATRGPAKYGGCRHAAGSEPWHGHGGGAPASSSHQQPRWGADARSLEDGQPRGFEVDERVRASHGDEPERVDDPRGRSSALRSYEICVHGADIPSAAEEQRHAWKCSSAAAVAPGLALGRLRYRRLPAADDGAATRRRQRSAGSLPLSRDAARQRRLDGNSIGRATAVCFHCSSSACGCHREQQRQVATALCGPIHTRLGMHNGVVALTGSAPQEHGP